MATALLIRLLTWLLWLLPRTRGLVTKVARWLPAIAGLGLAGLVLPIGQEEPVVRRNPWVSYAIMLLCLAVFQGQLLAEPGKEWRKATAVEWKDHWSYFAAHPYLRLTPFMADRCPACVRSRAQTLAKRGQEPPDPETLASEQKRLDVKAEKVVALLDATPTYRFGSIPGRGDRWTILSSIFMHADWLHLLGNMLVFFVTGPFVEDVFGRVLFGVLYLGAGVSGGLLCAHSDPATTIPSLGASGAIAGVMGAFLIRFASRRIRLLCVPTLWLPLVRFRLSLPAYVLLPPWLLQQFWSAHAGYEGVGWWAHIGGFLFGAAFALAVKLCRVEERIIDPGIERRITLMGNCALNSAIRLRLQGKHRAARAAIASAIRKDPQDLDARYEAYKIALAAGDRLDAGRYLTRAMELHARRPGPRAVRDIKEMEDFVSSAIEGLGDVLEPQFYLTTGAYFEEKVEASRALDVYQALVERHPGDPSAPRALNRQARILQRLGEPLLAQEKLAAARAHPACSPALAETVDSMLRLAKPRSPQPVIPAPSLSAGARA